MPDPIPRSCGILTERELAACVRVLTRVRLPVGSTIVLLWDALEHDAWIALSRAGYVEDLPAAPRGAFRWSRVRATEAGLTWLRQVGSTNVEYRETR